MKKVYAIVLLILSKAFSCNFWSDVWHQIYDEFSFRGYLAQSRHGLSYSERNMATRYLFRNWHELPRHIKAELGYLTLDTNQGYYSAMTDGDLGSFCDEPLVNSIELFVEVLCGTDVSKIRRALDILALGLFPYAHPDYFEQNRAIILEKIFAQIPPGKFRWNSLYFLMRVRAECRERIAVRGMI